MKVDLLGATPFDAYRPKQSFQDFLHPATGRQQFQTAEAQVQNANTIIAQDSAAAAKKKSLLTYAVLAVGAYFMLKG